MLHGGRAGASIASSFSKKQIAVDADGSADVFDTNGPTQMVTRIFHKPEFTSEATIAAFDEVIRGVQEKGIAAEELDPVKVKFRADYYSMLEGGMGSYMPRFGLMHYLACFTLFDGDPQRVNTILDGFLAVTPAAGAGRRAKISGAAKSRRALAPAGESRRCAVSALPPHPAMHSQSTPPALGPERPVAWPKRTVRTLVERHAGGSGRIAHVPENLRAALSSAAATPSSRTRAPGLAEMTATVVRTGTASRPSRRIEEDLRRMGADLGTHAGADTSAISISGLAEFSGGHARIGGRPRAKRFVSRG